MCCLYGILDYKQKLTTLQKNHILKELSVACEKRGTDATGIAYNRNGKLEINKAAVAARKFRQTIPSGVNVVMGHTRLTTQGNAKLNYNNHPFEGKCKNRTFALAHNGIIYNESKLRREHKLPFTKIETDSYVAVQMIEKTGTFNLQVIEKMASEVEGSFCFTLLDNKDNLYLIKGNNPLTIYHCKRYGFYIYASTEEILKAGLRKAGFLFKKYEKVDIEMGEVLILTAEGEVLRNTFNTSKIDCYQDFWFGSCRPYSYSLDGSSGFMGYGSAYGYCHGNYLECLIEYGENMGVSEDEILFLYENGFEEEEIESLLYAPELLRECISEMLELEQS